MYWYSDGRSIQFNFNRQKVGEIGLSMDADPALYFLKHFKIQVGLPVKIRANLHFVIRHSKNEYVTWLKQS